MSYIMEWGYKTPNEMDLKMPTIKDLLDIDLDNFIVFTSSECDYTNSATDLLENLLFKCY